MQKHGWTIWLVLLLAATLAIGVGCDGLVDDDDDDDIGPEGEDLIGTWLRQSTTEADSMAGDYAGLVLLSNGSGTYYAVYENDNADDEVMAEYIEWSVEDGEITVNVIDPQTQDTTTYVSSYTLNTTGNVLTVTTTMEGTTITEVFVKFDGDTQDPQLVGSWIITDPAEMAGVRIELAADGSGSITEPGDDTPETFSWGTHEGYVGVLLYQDAVGFVAPYTVTENGFTMELGDEGQVTLAPYTAGGDGPGEVVTELVGTWALKSMTTTDGDVLDARVTMILEDDNSGEVRVFIDEDEGTSETNSMVWGEVADGLLRVEMNNSDGTTDTMTVSYTVDGDLMELEVPAVNEMPAMTQAYVRWTDNRPAQYYGTFIAAGYEITDLNGDPLPMPGPPMQMTLVLAADGGMMYEMDDYGDGDGPTASVAEYDSTSFNWSVTSGHYVEMDPETGVGHAFPFTFEEVDGTAKITATLFEYFWNDEQGEEMVVQIHQSFYRFSGANPAGMAGFWVAYLAAHGDYLPAPPLNLDVEADGSGRAVSMEFDEDTFEEIVTEEAFNWYTGDGRIIVQNQADPFGMVMPYALEGLWMDLFLPPFMMGGPNGDPGMQTGPDTLMFVQDNNTLDTQLYGSWELVDVTENGDPADVDPNMALAFADDGTATISESDDDGNAVSYNVQWSVQNGWTNVIMVDMEEPPGEPVNDLHMAARYAFDDATGNLVITFIEPGEDMMEGPVERVETYAPATF